MPRCLPDMLTCLPHISQTAYLTCPPDIWTCLSDILPRKNAKMSPGHLSMPLRHFAWNKPRHIAWKKMPRCLPDILTCLPHISQTAYLTCPPDIWTCLSGILPRKNAKMSPGHLSMSPRHPNMYPRHLNMSPRHLNMSPRHLTSTRRNVARCLSDILTCLPDILTCRPDIVQFFVSSEVVEQSKVANNKWWKHFFPLKISGGTHRKIFEK